MLSSRLKTRPHNLFKLTAMSLVVATLSGCGEDAKDCGGFWDKTFGREACATPSVVKNTVVSVQLASTATQGKKVEIMSMVDVVPIGTNQSVQIDTRQRDTVMALIDDKIALFALKYDEKPVSLTPASTATYLVLQIKGMLDLPDQQLKQAITDIESDVTYPKLVSYINFKVQSGFSDPLNVDADPALMQLVVEISNKLDVTKYQTISTALSDSKATQQSYTALPTRKSISVGDVLLALVGIQTAYADESTIMGNNELVLGQPESNNVKFTNYTFNPFFAYINNDGSQSGKWNYVAGKGSIVDFDFKLADIEKAANIQADDGRFMRMLKRMAAIPNASIKQGKQETTLTLNGVNGSGKNALYVESQGLCQTVLDAGSIDEMTSQQLVASAINGFSLFMAIADVALKANELAVAQDALVKELTSPVNIAQSVAEYKKIKELLNKAKLSKEQALEKLEKIKMFNDFFKAFVTHTHEIKEKNKLPIENELVFLEGALDATDKILDASESYVKVFNTTPEKRKSFLKELGSALGDTLKEESIEAAAKALAEYIYNKDYKVEHSTKFYEGMSQYTVKVLQTSDVVAALFPVKGDDVDALKVIDAITHNEFFQEIFSTAIQKAAPSVGKAMLKGGYRKKAAQFNVASKAASLTWGIGTKLLPMMWDSCTTSKKLSIGIVNGKISQYQAPKVDLWIEDLTTGKPVYWYNNMGDSLNASGDTMTAIQGRKYRIHLKSKQAGVLDRSLDNQSDAVHKSWIRTPVKVNGLFIRRTTVENESQILAHKQLCARRALQDGNTMVYGLNQFTTLSGFSCVEGQVGSGDAQLFSPPFNQTQGFVQYASNVNVNYATTTYREGSPFSSWQELTSGATKNLGFGGEVSNTFDFTEDKLTKSLLIEIEGFNDEAQQGEDAKQTFDIRVINNADAVINSNAQASAANGIVYVGEAITAQLTQIVGKVVGVFWRLVNSLGEVVQNISATVGQAISFPTTDLTGGAYQIKAELRDENAEPIGVVSQSIQLAQTDFKSVNVQSIPVGVPVTITVYGKDLPSTTVFAVEGVPCGEPIVAIDSVTQVCTASEAKNNVKLTVKRKTQVDEGSRIFTINITPKSVTGQFVVPATSVGVEFIPPVDNEPVMGTLGQVLEYGASRRKMTCSFNTTGQTKTYRNYDLVDANGYSTGILPLHNGLPNMALVANDALIGVEKKGVVVNAGENLSFKLNDNSPADNEGALTVAYSCEELVQSNYTVLNRNSAECVQDNKTGLIWEQKTDDGGLRDKDWAYSWYDPNPATNGGFAGYQDNRDYNYNDTETCGGNLTKCNTQAYVAALNAANYCGYSDWRMPAIGELRSLVNAFYQPRINPIFVNMQSLSFTPTYWSASSYADDKLLAWGENFYDDGADDYGGKNYASHVRAVRTGLASGLSPTWTINPTNGHQYAAVDCGTWTQCEAQAVALGAHLVSVNDAAENAWLVSTFTPTKNYWIGLTDKDQEGVWKWTSGEAFGYSNWVTGEPNNVSGTENYVHMNYNYPTQTNRIGQWNDAQNDITGVGVGGVPYNSSAMGIFEKSSSITATISVSSAAPVAGAAVTFSFVDTAVDGIKAVVWKVGEAVVKVLTSIADFFEYIFDISGEYTITALLKDADDHVVLAPSVSVQVASQLPVASLVGSAITGVAGQPVTFVLSNSVAKEGKLCSYLFNNGEGLDSGNTGCGDDGLPVVFLPITMTYTKAGTFTPTLTVTDSQGKSATVTWRVTVSDVSTGAWMVTTLAGTVGVVGSVDGTGAAAAFYGPGGIAVDAGGTAYLADYPSSTIRRITPAGVVITLAGTALVQGSADGNGASASFTNPLGVALDANGNVYVADPPNQNIRKITPAGVVTTLAGTVGVIGSTDGTGSSALFSSPNGIAVDASGTIYVADRDNKTIRKITPAGVVTTLAGKAGVVGNADGTGMAASFNSPAGIAVTASGTVYVADSGNDTIRRITPAGVVTTLAGSFSRPTGVAVDANGTVYVADSGNNTIRKITQNGVVTTLAGTLGVQGSADGKGDAALFNEPLGIAVDASGTVYVTDYGNRTIRKITPALAVSSGATGLLNDTGITQCSNESTLFADCTAASMGGWFGLNQDGEVGRDFLAVKGQLAKTGAGDAGFDFTKISATGDPLPDSATQWNCVKDNHTGLMWEVKTNDGGLRDKDNTYQWYNPDTSTNGGSVGYNGSNNTQAFAQAVNTQALCGHNDWRLPNKQELHSIVNYGKYNPSIDSAYFPNTVSGWYWSSSPYASNSGIVWFLDFDYGYDSYIGKSASTYVRLVRSGQ